MNKRDGFLVDMYLRRLEKTPGRHCSSHRGHACLGSEKDASRKKLSQLDCEEDLNSFPKRKRQKNRPKQK